MRSVSTSCRQGGSGIPASFKLYGMCHTAECEPISKRTGHLAQHGPFSLTLGMCLHSEPILKTQKKIPAHPPPLAMELCLNVLDRHTPHRIRHLR